MQKKQKLNKKVITLSLVTGLLAGTNSMTLGVYDYQTDKLNKINSHSKVKLDEKVSENMSLRDELFNLNNNLYEQQTEVEQLNEKIKSKDDKIHRLEKQLEKATKRNESPSRSSVSKPMPSRGETDQRRQVNVIATAYTSYCDTGCTGETATGIDVSSKITHQGLRVIAVDPSVIPLRSIVRVDTVNDSFLAYTGDTGGAIKGYRIDVLVSINNKQKAFNFGKQHATVTIIKESS